MTDETKNDQPADELASSLFVSDTTVQKREVKLPSGKVHVMYFRDLSQKDFRLFHEGNSSKDPDVRQAASARLIAASVCRADGALLLTEEKALTLKPVAVIAMTNAVLAVNEFTEGND